MSKKQTAESFWARVAIRDDGYCWEWQGALSSQGYGNLSWGGKIVKAHRVAAWLSGKLADIKCSSMRGRGAEDILHTCDNPKCCNPSHRKAGSHGQNMADAAAKGRFPSGSRHAMAKLTDKQAACIRDKFANGYTQRALSVEYSVCVHTIHKITCNKSYAQPVL